MRPFAAIKDHVLLPQASQLEEADRHLRELLTTEVIHHIVSLVPGEWLQPPLSHSVYEQFLLTRIQHSSVFVNQAQHARSVLI